MPMGDTVPVLWLDGTDAPSPVELDAAVAWCIAHPTGWLFVGNATNGTNQETLGWDAWASLSRALTFRSHIQRNGVTSRTLVGFRPDVLAVKRTKFLEPAPGLQTTFVARSPGLQWRSVVNAWNTQGWTLEWAAGIDADFLSTMPVDATLYTVPTAAQGQKLPISGVVANMLAPGYAAWVVGQAQQAVGAWLADGLLVGCKAWLRSGQPWMRPGSPTPSGGLVQPSPFGAGKWEGGTYTILQSFVGAGIPVVTMTYPTQPPLPTYIGNGVAVVGECHVDTLN